MYEVCTWTITSLIYHNDVETDVCVLDKKTMNLYVRLHPVTKMTAVYEEGRVVHTVVGHPFSAHKQEPANSILRLCLLRCNVSSLNESVLDIRMSHGLCIRQMSPLP